MEAVAAFGSAIFYLTPAFCACVILSVPHRSPWRQQRFVFIRRPAVPFFCLLPNLHSAIYNLFFLVSLRLSGYESIFPLPGLFVNPFFSLMMKVVYLF